MNEQKELRLQTGNGWTCESSANRSSFFSSSMAPLPPPSLSSDTEEVANDESVSNETDHLIRTDDRQINKKNHIHSSVSVISSTSNGLSQNDVRSPNGAAAPSLHTNGLNKSGPARLDSINFFETNQNEPSSSLLIDKLEDGLYGVESLEDQCDPLQLPHSKYEFPVSREHSLLISNAISTTTSSSRTSNKCLSNQRKQLRQGSRLSPSTVKQLNVDMLSIILAIIVLVLCGFLHEYLLPHMDLRCRTMHSGWYLWSNVLSITAAASLTIYLVGWFVLTKSRFYRQQTLFVVASILILTIASANAMWAVSAFLKLDCEQSLAAEKIAEERAKLLYMESEQHSRLDNFMINEGGESDEIIDDIRLPIEPQPTMEAIVSKDQLLVMEENSTIKPIIEFLTTEIPFTSNESEFPPPQPEWFTQLLFNYDLKVVGIFHWLITLMLVALTLRLMAKRRRYGIECLKRRGLLIEYYWATMD